MSNYTKSTNFTAKDSLPTGDTNKVIRGSEFDTEFNAIQTAVGTKADLAGPTFTGTATFDGITATGTVNFTGGSVTTNIDGGTIDGVTIGGSSAGAGTFSSLTATTADINAGTVDNTVIGGSTPAAGTFSSLTATTANIDGGSIDGAVIGGSTPAAGSFSTADIDGGTIDNTVIGGTTPAAVSGTTGTFSGAVSGTTGTFSGAVSGTTGTFSGAVTGSNLNVSNWDTAYGWGDHSTQGYLTSVTFSDIDAGAVTLSTETFVDSDTQIPTNAAVIDYVAATIPLITEVNDLTVSVTWANVPDANITQSSVTQHQAALSITASQLSDVTSTAAELNILDGVTATTAELNYTDGVTSNIQTQLDSKVGANYTGDVDITGELLVDSYNETFKKVSSVGAVSGYGLSSASYASKSFSVASQDSAPYGGIFMKPDGTKMWYLSANLSDVFQYSLSTAYDVSTASYDSVSFSVTAQDATPQEIYFKTDGTKFYVVGDTNNTVFQYALTTAWDLSTASYESKSFSVATQETAPKGIEFKPDGTKMFIVGASGDDVNRYSLSTAWDVSTASFDSQTLDVSSQDTAPQSIAFNSDGTVLFMLGQANNKVFKYTLSTAYDLSTGSYSSTDFSTASQDTAPYGLHFNDSGKKMYVIGDQNDTVYQYNTSSTTYTTTFDCENANVFETELDANTTVVFSNPPASGTPVVTNYNLANASYDSVSLDVSSQNTTPVAVEFSSDGTAMYMVGNTDPDTVFQYTLSTAWDLSTASYASKSFSTSTQETGVAGLSFKSDGTKMYIVGTGNDTVYQYSLSTAWDVSTASYDSTSVSVSSQDTTPSALNFSPDGTKMYVVGDTNNTIFQYTLSTAWDVSTATYATKSLSVASEETAPTGMAFNSDGTKVFVCGRSSDAVQQYSLSTAYDISTGSYDSVSFSIVSQDTNSHGIAFKSDGSKMYIAGYDSDSIYQYSTSSSVLNDSTAYAMSLKVVQDSGASGYTVTWPTSVDWPSATAPTLTATASAVDQFVFYTYDGGTTWYGFTAGQALG